MSHAESAIAELFDHQQQRRREAPDWGGDDLFTAVPARRRRFDRAVASTAAREDEDVIVRRPDTLEHPVQRPAARRAAAEAASAHPLEIAPAFDPGRTVNGRRTVTITGRPDGMPPRRRPAPTLDERLTRSRPDRVAMYAFALGVLLIVIAFLSANG